METAESTSLPDAGKRPHRSVAHRAIRIREKRVYFPPRARAWRRGRRTRGEGRIRTCVGLVRPDLETCSWVPDQPLRAPLPVSGFRFPVPFTRTRVAGGADGELMPR